MADDMTVLDNLIDPQVMTAQISAKLPKAIRFGSIAPVDTTLEGQPGDVITVSISGMLQTLRKAGQLTTPCLRRILIPLQLRKLVKGSKLLMKRH